MLSPFDYELLEYMRVILSDNARSLPRCANGDFDVAIQNWANGGFSGLLGVLTEHGEGLVSKYRDLTHDSVQILITFVGVLSLDELDTFRRESEPSKQEC